MISLFLVVLAAIFNAGMDVISSRYPISIFSRYRNLQTFIDPILSHKNKWKYGNKMYGEKFFGSSTFLVWTTDAWHLFKTSMLACFAIAIVVYNPILHPVIDALGYWIIFGAVFELFWSKIFLK